MEKCPNTTVFLVNGINQHAKVILHTLVSLGPAYALSV